MTPVDPFTWMSKGWTITSNIYTAALADTECSQEDLPGVIDGRGGCRERVREIRAGNANDADAYALIAQNYGFKYFMQLYVFM